MIGSLDPSSRQATVVGAGVAGLLMADALDRAGYEVTLLEAADRAGGLIGTSRAPWGMAEQAAHSIQATPAVLELCRRLDVELLEVRRDSRARFVWRGGRLRKFPLTIREALKAFARAYFVPAARGTDPGALSLEQWARRHLGQAALDYLIVPFVRGIYGARPGEIRVSLAFPSLAVPAGHSLLSYQLYKLRRRLFGHAPGPKRARPRMMAPREGMGAIARALETSLRARLGDRFKLGHAARELPSAPNVVLCVPAAEAARLLEAQDPALAKRLRGVEYSPLVSVTAFVEKRSFPAPPRGVGVLLPEGTERRTLGVLFNSSSFEGRIEDPSERVSLTAMLGGSARPEVVSATDIEIQAWLREDLEKILDLAPGARIDTVIHRWPRAVPRYGAGLQEAWDAARRGWCSEPGRVLFGNYTGQVSIRGMVETAQNVV
jgi:oxygen-dependent protoporphyrinogen oxidase